MVRRIEEGDLRYLYAAYRLGAWKDAFPEGLPVAEFLALVERAALSVNDVFVMVGKTARGEIPVGVIALRLHDGNLWPAVRWFSWASVRNRLEGALAFLDRPLATVLFPVRTADKRFLNHLCRYGIAQRVGTVQQYFPDGDPAALFQSRKV